MEKNKIRSRYEVKIFDNDSVEVDVKIKDRDDATLILSELMYMCLSEDIQLGVQIIEVAREVAVERLAKEKAKSFIEKYALHDIDSLGKLFELLKKEIEE